MDRLRNEIWRKGVHISGIFFLPILFWNRTLFVTLLWIFLVCYLLVEATMKRGVRIPLLATLTARSKRPSESGRLAMGPILLVAAGITTPYLFGIEPAAVGLAQIFVADVASTFAGVTWGKQKLPYSRNKSWIGSAAFLAAAFLVSLYFASPLEALALAAVGTVAESLPIPEADNLTVPLAVGLTAHFIL